MNNHHKAIKSRFYSLLKAAVISMVWFATASQAQVMSDYSATPPMTSFSESQRMIMLTLSVDHQLFMKAYNDYDDLTNDGQPNTTYEHSYDYIGYFDHGLCYSYSSDQFVPVIAAGSDGYCDSEAPWSGNFLNWATMTRIDLVRHVLYGGYRSEDTEDMTVLERSYLPQDAHSFSKYFPGDSLAGLADVSTVADCPEGSGDPRCEGFTFCNTTQPPSPEGRDNRLSQDVTEPPLLRVVRGNYSLWDASERYQCLTYIEPYYNLEGERIAEVHGNSEMPYAGISATGSNLNESEVSGIHAFSHSPTSGRVTDFKVRVQVCDPATVPDGRHLCKGYGEEGAIYKPIGLLQEYGEGTDVLFGLMTGSYNSNKEFGALRKNASAFDDEVDPETGKFLYSGGESMDSIIGNIDALRMVDYQFYEGSLDVDTNNERRGTYNTNCLWGVPRFNNGDCRNWGNPFNDLLSDSYRYLAAAGSARRGIPNSNLPAGLSIAEWPTPEQHNERFACPNMNVLGFNTSAVSYDWTGRATDSPSALGIPGSTTQTLQQLTLELGAAAGLHGKDYFVGMIDDSGDGQCTPKQVNNLGLVSGTCPETPRLGGGYLGAGLARYMHDNHQVNTFGVTLSGALPTIRVPLGNGSEVNIVPACSNRGRDGNGDQGNCAIVNFKPISVEGGKGSFFIGWEDSEQGGDYDIDASGLINYEVDGDTIKVTTKLLYDGTADNLLFGYVITGTTADNLYFPAAVPQGVPESLIGKDTTHECHVDQGCVSNVADGYAQQTITFTLGEADVDFLESPLYYASTYGSGVGERGYTNVSNPNQLRQQLGEVINTILNRPTAGTRTAVASSALAGDGLILHSLYYPEVKGERDSIDWVSTFSGLFYDEHGKIREGSAREGTQVLTDASPTIEFFLDSETQTTRFKRTTVNTDNPETIDESSHDLSELNPVWDARKWLAELDQDTIGEQRAYGSPGDRRYIFTAIPGADYSPNNKDVMAFVGSNFGTNVGANDGLGNNNYRLLDVAQDAAPDLVDFIRGKEALPGFRSRTVDGERWLLGDIIHSTPVIVGRPSAVYGGARYSDYSYSAFREHYRNRRQVAYVGANDGMLHAFNAGFFDYDEQRNPRYSTALDGDTTKHDLGAELWAYVPYNLLPHLQWLADPNYSHVYYVDSNVNVFDVNIFDSTDDDYPGGWGTILVVGMRFGGGDFAVDVNGDGDGDERTLRSAYVILDVTNPEKPPRLLGEISHESLGHTSGDVEIFKFRDIYGGSDQNKWYLTFGSGPQDFEDGTSSQRAKLFYLDLNKLADGSEDLGVVEVPLDYSYIGGVTVADWDGDYKDDMLYLSVVSQKGGEAGKGGALMQVPLNSASEQQPVGAPNLLLNGVDLPFSRAPLALGDSMGNYWVFAGTGRFLVQQDIEGERQHHHYGLKVNAEEGDKPWRTTADIDMRANSLVDVSDYTVRSNADGSVVEVYDGVSGEPQSPEAIEDKVAQASGWKKDYGPNELHFTRAAFFERTLIINTFLPGSSEGLACEPGGSSFQYTLDMFTGLPQTRIRNINWVDGTAPVGSDGMGEVSDSTQQSGILGDPKVLGFIPRSESQRDDGSPFTGDHSLPPLSPVRHSWRELELDEVGQ